MTDNNELMQRADRLTYSGAAIFGVTRPIRMQSQTPVAYRLVKRGDQYVLQGQFHWSEGSMYGHEWKDLPTIEEEA